MVWQATDPNFDKLIYSISIRSIRENQWRLLKKNWKENIFAFDTYGLPDGTYLLKVEASDRISNPPGGEEIAEKITRRLVIDNSLPEVRNLKASRSGSVLKISFSAADSMSAIREVKVLVRPDVWAVVFPEDGICDSPSESFEFSLPLPQGADNMVTVKVRDERGNIGVARTTF
jgi:hypothetical protein